MTREDSRRTLDIPLPPGGEERVIAALCAREGYQPNSPEDALAFACRSLYEFVQREVLRWETAAELARQAQLAGNPVAAPWPGTAKEGER